MILIVVSYDVSTTTAAGRRRLRKVAKVCEDFGQRVQNSVFECWVDPVQLIKLKRGLLDLLEPATQSNQGRRRFRNGGTGHGSRA